MNCSIGWWSDAMFVGSVYLDIVRIAPVKGIKGNCVVVMTSGWYNDRSPLVLRWNSIVIVSHNVVQYVPSVRVSYEVERQFIMLIIIRSFGVCDDRRSSRYFC